MRHLPLNRIITSLSVLALCALIGVMSWHEMHGAAVAPTAQERTAFFSGYYIPEDAKAVQLPDDAAPVIVFQGTLDAKGHIEPKGIEPTLFAQREVNLALRLETPSVDAAKMAESVITLTKKWQRMGNVIIQLIIDYRPKNPDFAGYARLLKDVHEILLKNKPLSLIMAAEPAWLTAEMAPQVAPALKTTAGVLIMQEGAHLDPLLQKSRWQFQVVLPKGQQPPPQGSIKNMPGLFSMFVTWDSQAPPPPIKRKIGLLPLSEEEQQ